MYDFINWELPINHLPSRGGSSEVSPGPRPSFISFQSTYITVNLPGKFQTHLQLFRGLLPPSMTVVPTLLPPFLFPLHPLPRLLVSWKYSKKYSRLPRLTCKSRSVPPSFTLSPKVCSKPGAWRFPLRRHHPSRSGREMWEQKRKRTGSPLKVSGRSLRGEERKGKGNSS